MNYDNIVDNLEPNHFLKIKAFNSYIRPYLKYEVKGHELSYYMGKSQLAWILNISEIDIKNTVFVAKICEELFDDYGDEFLNVLSEMFAIVYDVNEQLENSERLVYNSQENKRQYSINLANQYKDYFESGFRLYSTTLYYYLCKKYSIKYIPDIKLFPKVSAGEKLKGLNLIDNLAGIKNSFTEFSDGFDNKWRNRLGAHNRYEVDDEGNIVCEDFDDRKIKVKKVVNIGVTELENKLHTAKKTLRILEIGLSLFLTNNPVVNDKLQQSMKNKNMKIGAMKHHLKEVAKDRHFALLFFDYDKKNQRMQIKIKYTPPILGENSEVFFGGIKYQLINREENVPYDLQVIGLIRTAVSSIDLDNTPEVSIKVLDENKNEIGNAIFEGSELRRVFELSDKEILPTPKVGNLPKGKYKLKFQIQFPFGEKYDEDKLHNWIKDCKVNRNITKNNKNSF